MRFKASQSWATKFKARNHIVSRSITHKVGPDYYVKQQDKRVAADEFVAQVRQTIQTNGYQPHEVINFDQSLFQKEIKSGRTLNKQGEKKIFGAVDLINASTHSYMVMPYIDASGGLCPRLYLKTPEASGTFPAVRRPNIPSNISAHAGTSAMMTTSDLETFLEILITDFISRKYTKALFIADSWSSNKNDKLWNSLVKKYRNEIQLQKMIVPPGTTGMVQPCDVFFFRQWKSFTRHISDAVEVNSKIHLRDHFLALQAFVH
ncbi:hypothetical protein X777_01996 [Ooceraea biroi]|uniref:DDE-1 domain-containing protein n=1 Tax=Ooceraea biroi TaxID=2015173 RepID=A0A026WPT0_OOCBI|nr:hypothetical protein X777_01996 [Ooceraea biroi]